ncbi:MAG TPA: DUF3859 domain-containing protein [Burkholderiales bacterium]|nr:DUF3859 domain-containing protein [Burkholderiales bacterium]
MKLSIAVITLLALANELASAHHGRLQDHLLRGTILSYGVYSTASGAFLQRAAHAPGGPAGIELVEQTTILPAQPGTRFGFCVSVAGALEDGDLDLEKVILHPPIFGADGAVLTGYEQEIELTVSGGEATACLGHTLENETEAVPGKWTVRLMAADQVIAEKTFELR